MDPTNAPKSPLDTVQAPTVRRTASFGGGGKRCHACNKTVYPIEAVNVDDKVFHDKCFKCAHERCGNRLELGTYASVEGTFYCKPHYSELFKLKGDYSTAFGKRSPSMNWSDKKRRDSVDESSDKAGEAKRKLFIVTSPEKDSATPTTEPAAAGEASKPLVVESPAATLALPPVQVQTVVEEKKVSLPSLTISSLTTAEAPQGLPTKTPRTTRNQSLKTPRVSTPRQHTQEETQPTPSAAPTPAPTPAPAAAPEAASTTEASPASAPAASAPAAPAASPAPVPAPAVKGKKVCVTCSILLKPGSNCSPKQLKNKAPKCYACAQVSHEAKRAEQARQKVDRQAHAHGAHGAHASKKMEWRPKKTN